MVLKSYNLWDLVEEQWSCEGPAGSTLGVRGKTAGDSWSHTGLMLLIGLRKNNAIDKTKSIATEVKDRSRWVILQRPETTISKIKIKDTCGCSPDEH